MYIDSIVTEEEKKIQEAKIYYADHFASGSMYMFSPHKGDKIKNPFMYKGIRYEIVARGDKISDLDILTLNFDLEVLS